MPELVRVSMLDLGGIQPVTSTMAETAGGMLSDTPSAGEIELFQQSETRFQLVSVVVNLIASGSDDGHFQGKPFAVTLIPASKRGEVSYCTIDLIEKLDVGQWLKTDPAYVGYDPFSGEWLMYGGLGVLMNARPTKGFIDEIGLVVDQFFLATDFDPDDVLVLDVGMPTDKLAQKY
ncbi:MAG: hypothetical protein WCH04_18135 [Gammaproteobacteria bacterium]